MSAETNPEKRKKRLTGIALVVGGLLLWMFGCAGVTPASVFVSGFYRSDGTYVGSYNRQPRGLSLTIPHSKLPNGWGFSSCVLEFIQIR